MATGQKELKTPMELAAKKDKAKALTALEEYTQVKTLVIFSFSFFSDLYIVSGCCFYWKSSGDSTSDVVPTVQADRR